MRAPRRLSLSAGQVVRRRLRRSARRPAPKQRFDASRNHMPTSLSMRPGTPFIALAVTCALAGCGSGDHRAGSTPQQPTSTTAVVPPPTTSHLFAPFNGGGLAAGVTVGKSAKGYCWTGSAADTRRDAWRCFLGNLILDPCFSNETGTSEFVACADSPWSRVTRLVLTKSLPRGQANPEANDPTSGAPWALELADGKRCERFTGATGAIGGLGISYGCTGGGVLAGEPHRQTTAWTIFYGSGFKAKALDERPIVEAWW
jgi:hypothetical protein